MAELADATDLKSVDFNNREGSSPSIPKWERISLLGLDYRKGQQNKWLCMTALVYPLFIFLQNVNKW